MSTFATAQARLDRAREHRAALGRTWDAYLGVDDAYDVNVSVGVDGRGEIWVEPLRPVPVSLSLELGELLYQLRAALDSCVYDAAVRETSENPPPNEEALEFPICETTQGFASSQRKIASMKNERIRDFITKVQPCHRSRLTAPGAEWVPQSLSLLHNWARRDRHRRLQVVGAWPSSANPQFRLPPGVSVRSLNVEGIRVLLDQPRTCAVFALDGWESGMSIEANPDVVIDLATAEPPLPVDATDTLDMRTQQLIAVVELVVRAFEHAY